MWQWYQGIGVMKLVFLRTHSGILLFNLILLFVLDSREIYLIGLLSIGQNMSIWASLIATGVSFLLLCVEGVTDLPSAHQDFCSGKEPSSLLLSPAHHLHSPFSDSQGNTSSLQLTATTTLCFETPLALSLNLHQLAPIPTTQTTACDS